MRSAPRKHSEKETLYATAMAALMRRAYSVFEMRAYLERRAEKVSLAREVLSRLRQEKLIDDARYARDFARVRANSRHQGRYRITRELRTRGVADNLIEGALEEVFAETNESELVGKLIARRIRAARGPLDANKTASLYRTLLRAGFDAQLIRREVQQALRGEPAAIDLPELPSPDDLPTQDGES